MPLPAARRNRARAQTLILFALILPLLVLVGLGFAVDGGNLYLQRRLAQTAADAGALAGARAIGMRDDVSSSVAGIVTTNTGPGGSSQLVSARWTDTSGNDLGAVSGGAPGNAGGVRVTTRRTATTAFAGLIGMPSIVVTADATALALGITSLTNVDLWPVAMWDQQYNYGQTYELFDKAQEASGNFGWLSMNGSQNAGDLASWLRNGYHVGGGSQIITCAYGASPGACSDKSSLDIPVWMLGNSGVNTTPTEQAATTRVGQMVIVMFYDRVSGTGSNARFRVQSFGEFLVVGVRHEGNSINLKGKFLRYVLPGQIGGSSPPSHGLYTVSMSQ